ncbi:protein of unknown function DUF59 [Magnetococcus marinus MC-1]|uniref:Iron-sulfur cluster carrier protein n=1 Tax=Magnetococcus marinus (strain ATCC BAA-1437 / JCM 17883 / MC-1) TaxID=156889 RepID=A0L4L0_MAGMM|nr:Mrp/NBP35 family ATP-binding protein [Magnetococcus marinus]ABK42903.1 protein of unknown function DUF59 [Magnetococcus marinus MC-1]
MAQRAAIVALFDQLQEPKLKWNINTLNLLQEVTLHEQHLRVVVHLITGDRQQRIAFEEQARQAIQAIHTGSLELIVAQAQVGTEGIQGVKRIILVASGKGGVGKSTVAVNLAVGLNLLGHKVGLMDADIYGPSVPTMLGCHDKPQVLPHEYLLPLQRHGIRFISTGSLVDPGKALDWRGPLVSGTLLQFITKTCWGELDYLIIDMPPGTGDAQLTIASKLKTHGVVLVTTPQEVAWGDVRRAIELFQKQQAPILGIVENMNHQVCTACGHQSHPLIHSQLPLPPGIVSLAQLPLAHEISQAGDAGVPLLLQESSSPAKAALLALAQRVAQCTAPTQEPA